MKAFTIESVLPKTNHRGQQQQESVLFCCWRRIPWSWKRSFLGVLCLVNIVYLEIYSFSLDTTTTGSKETAALVGVAPTSGSDNGSVLNDKIKRDG